MRAEGTRHKYTKTEEESSFLTRAGDISTVLGVLRVLEALFVSDIFAFVSKAYLVRGREEHPDILLAVAVCEVPRHE